MHYGYVGRVLGFSEKELLDGAAAAQAADDVLKRTKDLVAKLLSDDASNFIEGLQVIAGDPELQRELAEIAVRVQQGNVAALDNNDDSGSIELGFKIYREYGDDFVNDAASRDFILGIVRRRRKYAPGSELKKDALEGVC